MKVIQASAWFPPDSFGGVEVYLDGLVEDLRAIGLNCKVAAARTQNQSTIEQYRSTEVFRYPNLEAFQAWLRENQSDIYHQHTVRSSCGLPHLQSAKQLGMKTISTIHMPDISCLRGTMMQGGNSACDGKIDIARCSACLGVSKRVPNWASEALSNLPSSIAVSIRDRLRQSSDVRLRQLGTTIATPSQIRNQQRQFDQLVEFSDRIVLVCQWLYDAFVLNGVPESKLVLSRHGVTTPVKPNRSVDAVDSSPPKSPILGDFESLRHFGSKSPTRGGFRGLPRSTAITDQSGTSPIQDAPHSPIRIGFLGRWQETKGVQILAKALQQIPNVPVELVIHATHADRHGSTNREKVVSIANSDPRIQIKPPLARTEISPAIAQFDLLAVPSQWMETGPLVVLESFAMGTPVIGSDLGGIAELVQHRINGWLVPASDVKSWANAIAFLAQHPNTIAQLKQGIQPVKTRATVAQEMVELYQSLIREY
ncbi:glycosyl transferase group 1 [Leptolyngbya sp. NIES-3755]|nr:glycosyl transferase group 1 [Leptolyngbya sp. NIES-3755]